MEKYTIGGSKGKTFSRDNALLKSSRCHHSRRVPQRCRYSDSTPAKLVTEKCDKARNLVKLSARLGDRARASRRTPPAPEYVYSDPGKIPGISRREGTSWQHVLRIELLSMPAQLQRRLSLRTCRRNTWTRKRPRDLYTPFFPQKYHRHRSVENDSAYFRAPRRRSENFSSPKTSLTKNNAS